MGMMLHRHSGVADTTPDIVIKKEVKTAEPVVEEEEKKSPYVNDPVRRGRKRNN